MRDESAVLGSERALRGDTLLSGKSLRPAGALLGGESAAREDSAVPRSSERAPIFESLEQCSQPEKYPERFSR